MLNKTIYNETVDLMASLMTLNGDAYHLSKIGKLSEEKLQQIINITNVAIFKCEQEFLRVKK